MDLNKKFEALVGIGLDDYPSMEYSIIEEDPRNPSRHPRFISSKKLTTPILGIFDEVNVLTFPHIYNRIMTLVSHSFKPDQMQVLEDLVNGLVEIYGGDNKRMLWLQEEEIEQIILGKWEGRVWEFDKYEDVHDVFLIFDSQNRLTLTLKETGNLLDFD